MVYHKIRQFIVQFRINQNLSYIFQNISTLNLTSYIQKLFLYQRLLNRHKFFSLEQRCKGLGTVVLILSLPDLYQGVVCIMNVVLSILVASHSSLSCQTSHTFMLFESVQQPVNVDDCFVRSKGTPLTSNLWHLATGPWKSNVIMSSFNNSNFNLLLLLHRST